MHCEKGQAARVARIRENTDGPRVLGQAEIALDYHSRGWAVIPVPFRSKNPGRLEWEKERHDEAAIRLLFNGQLRNIGVLTGEPSDWIIDVDLDCQAAIDLAPQHLPATGSIFGRRSKPKSHYIYQATGPIKTDRTCISKVYGQLLELRSTGGQTVFPGSTHPSDESIEWESDEPPAKINPDDLTRVFRTLGDAVVAKMEVKKIDAAYVAMMRITEADHNDGSRRLLTVACRAVEHGLTDQQAIDAIRAYERKKPFPKAWSDDDIIRRLRDAEQKAERGKVDVKPQRRRTHSQPTTSSPTLSETDTVQPEPLEWLWPGRVPLGKLTLIAGDPGLGKSLLTVDMASRVSAGLPWPDSSDPNPAGGVLMLSAEDDIADTIVPRLIAAGAHRPRVRVLTGVEWYDPNEDETTTGMFDLDRDIKVLAQAIAKVVGCRLVTIDPVSAFVGGQTDSHKNSDVRGLLAPLAELAQKTSVAVVMVTHLTKSGVGPALYRAMGSLAFVAASRAAWAVTKDKSTPGRRLMLPLKHNLAPDAFGLAFSVVEEPGEIPAPVLAWSLETIHIDVDEAMGGHKDNDADERKAAEGWLRIALADGPVPTKDVKRYARECGHTWATVRRAKDSIGAEAFKEGFASATAWYWRLPNLTQGAHEDAQFPGDTF